jgi:hypothetical protein
MGTRPDNSLGELELAKDDYRYKLFMFRKWLEPGNAWRECVPQTVSDKGCSYLSDMSMVSLRNGVNQ